MLTTIRKMGNSQGVLIPKPLLQQLGLTDQAEMLVEGEDPGDSQASKTSPQRLG
jgi:antitoxin component of MazEF toxin-antitoxin module